MNATEAIDKIVSLLGLQFRKEKFASTFLTDGTEVTNNMDENTDFEVGQTLYVVKESTLAPAPEGSHETREGIIVTLDSESTIIAIATKDVNETEVGVEVEDDDMKKEKMTIAEDAQGNRLESNTFDVGEEVFVLGEGDSKTPAPDGEHQVILKDESGNENKIRITTKDGVITQRENVEEMGQKEMMTSQFSKDIQDIKTSMKEMLELITSMNGKYKTEINSLKTDFDTFKKSPERKSVEEKKTYTESFTDYKLDLIKSLRNK